ncbi:MAG: diguanylate cyclase domain-containing protein [Bilophila wadsworthia]
MESMLEKRPEHPLHLLVLGLDGFKHINELYGKSFGDEILRVIGQRIQGMLPLSASVYAWTVTNSAYGEGNGFEMMGCTAPFRSSVPSRNTTARSILHHLGGQRSYRGRLRLYGIVGVCQPFAEVRQKPVKPDQFSRAILEQEMRSLELVELLRESIERQFEV